MTTGRIVIASNTSWSIINFRENLIRALLEEGYEVTVVAPLDDFSEAIPKIGCADRAVQMDNKGTNPLVDFGLFLSFYSCFRDIRPDCFLGFTIKPNIYGSIAAQLLGIPVVNNIAGLGTLFVRPSWVTIVASMLYRIALRRSRVVFFQNENDRSTFVGAGLTSEEQTERIPGSGVDTIKFSHDRYAKIMDFDETVRFLLLGRLLWEKGVGEYVEAARWIQKRKFNAEFQILGFLDVDNPSAISHHQIEQWVSEGVIEDSGHARDVRPYIARSDCIVLPSYYREGVPRSLLEAASMAKPVITTDTPGCRDVVNHG